MRHLPRLLVLDEVGSLFIQSSLVSGILLTTSTALLDAAKEDNGCGDGDDTANGSDDGNLGRLREGTPAVSDAVRFFNLLHGG